MRLHRTDNLCLIAQFAVTTISRPESADLSLLERSPHSRDSQAAPANCMKAGDTLLLI
jgi:hypothetical protein